MHEHVVVTTKISAAEGPAAGHAVARGRAQVRCAALTSQVRFAAGTAPVLTEIQFASCYAYSPSDGCAASRLLRTQVKNGDVSRLLTQAIQVDATARHSRSLVGLFSAGAILVPVPGSRPSSWGRSTAAERLAVALLGQGLGRRIWFGLRRVRAVPKSAVAAPGARPTVPVHYDTLAIDRIDRIDASSAAHIVLVDHVGTKGRTLFAAALRVREVLPLADVRAFALLRTLGYSADISQFLMPCVGTIEWKGEDARRNP